jgi:hypothetical protein
MDEPRHFRVDGEGDGFSGSQRLQHELVGGAENDVAPDEWSAARKGIGEIYTAHNLDEKVGYRALFNAARRVGSELAPDDDWAKDRAGRDAAMLFTEENGYSPIREPEEIQAENELYELVKSIADAKEYKVGGQPLYSELLGKLSETEDFSE